MKDIKDIESKLEEIQYNLVEIILLNYLNKLWMITQRLQDAVKISLQVF